jgi:nucleoside 2-deoxyribosyltransferase
MKPRIYLAGPDVFLLQAMEIADLKKEICAAHGLVGVFPMDAEIKGENLKPEDLAFEISQANEGLMRSCNAMIANITPFRGPSADPGTTFEMGFMRALGKAVFAYSNDKRPFLARTREWIRTKDVLRNGESRIEDDHEMSVENFGLADNLMLEGAIRASGGILVYGTAVPRDREFTDLTEFRTCVLQVQAFYSDQPTRSSA